MFDIKNKKLNSERLNIRKEIEQEYQKRIRIIADNIKCSANFITKRQILKNLFDWWNENIQYDYNILKQPDGGNNAISTIYYDYKGEKDIMHCGEKYAPILLGKGVCTSYSEAIKDICDLINIECKVVDAKDDNVLSAFKCHKHAWDEITIDGEVLTLDLDPHFLTFMGRRRTTSVFKIKEK